jgi:hypothetical protein
MKKIFFVIALFGLSGMLIAAEADQSTQENSAVGDSSVTETTVTETTTTETITTEAASTESATTADAAPEQAGFSRGSVVRSVFTTGIQEREPIDKLSDASAEEQQVYYFTELRDMSGQTAVHRWEKDGDVKAEVKFDVRGPRWRVWSSKSFQPTTTGEWKVSVLNGAGEVIAEETLNLTAPAQATESAAQSDPAEQPAQEVEPPVNEKLIQ